MTPETTEALICRLAAGPPPPRLSGRAVAGAVLAGLIPAVGLFLLILEPRPDLATAAVLAKIALASAVAVIALALALRSARPVGAVPTAWLALPGMAAVALFLATLVRTPAGRIGPEMLGQTAAACLLSITALSLVPLAGGVMLLRRGAPLHPGRTGALIGLAAGAAAAAGYALHCNEDSPLFFVLWYGLGIAIAAGLGALAGRRWLRW